MIYYCELKNQEDPYFPDYMTHADTDELAMMFFINRHGPDLRCVYTEDFRIVWEL